MKCSIFELSFGNIRIYFAVILFKITVVIMRLKYCDFIAYITRMGFYLDSAQYSA